MQVITGWIREHKSAIATRVLVPLAVGAITAVIGGLFSGWFNDGSGGEQNSASATSTAVAQVSEGDIRYEGTTGDSISMSVSQGGDVPVTASNAAQSGNSNAEIQNNANQSVTFVLASEDESEETEPTGPSPNGNQSDSAGGDGVSDEQGQPPSTGDLIRVVGTEDVYEVQGLYRRLIVADGIINRVPQWHWDDIKDVTRAVMSRYEVSRLVRLPNDGDKVYRVISADVDSAVLRHIPDEDTFGRAGCEWNAVYNIAEQEASFSGYSKGKAMPSSGWSC